MLIREPKERKPDGITVSVDLYNDRMRTIKYLILIYDMLTRRHPDLEESTFFMLTSEGKYKFLTGLLTGEPDIDLCLVTSLTGITSDEFLQSVEDARKKYDFTMSTNPPICTIENVKIRDAFIVTVGDVVMEINSNTFKHLTTLGVSKSELYEMVLRYTDMGLGSRYFNIVGHNVYKWLELGSKIPTVECFASPFDKTLKKYCSPFSEDVDSMGNFFGWIRRVVQKAETYLLLIHPPDIEYVMDACVRRSYEYVAGNPMAGAIVFLPTPSQYLEKEPVSGVTKIINMGYNIYAYGTVPNLDFLMPPAEERILIGVPTLRELVRSDDIATNRKIFEMLKSRTELNENQLSRIHTILEPSRSDRDYYDAYKRELSRKGKKAATPWMNIRGGISGRARSRVRDISKYINIYAPQPGQYLDIGCADGSITKAIGMNLHATEIYGTDLQNTLNPDYDVIFVKDYNEIFNNSMKVITALMTLHHIENIQGILEQISRMLIPGGIFILREHAFTNSASVGIVMVEHIVYDYVLADGDFEKVLETNRLYPRTKQEMINGLVNVGLELIEEWEPNSVDYAYYAVFRKQGTICNL